MESTFLNSDCLDVLKVRYAASVFQKQALTWWNVEKRTRGNKSAMSLSWDEMRQLMTDEFCPRNEMRKLEAEFWDLTQDSGENLAYTTRFQELSLLVPHMVTPLARRIEKYIGGLPMPIQDTVLGSDPSTLGDAIHLSAVLTDNHVKAGTLSRKSTKKVVDKAATPVSGKGEELKSSHHDRKRKAQNFTAIIPAVPVTQVTPAGQILRNYVGSFPQCPTCKYHHAPHAACRLCSKCGRYGHVVTTCRTRTIVNQATQGNHPMPLTVTYGRACYECGDPNHFRNQCPRLQNQGGPRGRAFNINANEAPANDDTVNVPNPSNYARGIPGISKGWWVSRWRNSPAPLEVPIRPQSPVPVRDILGFVLDSADHFGQVLSLHFVSLTSVYLSANYSNHPLDHSPLTPGQTRLPGHKSWSLPRTSGQSAKRFGYVTACRRSLHLGTMDLVSMLDEVSWLGTGTTRIGVHAFVRSVILLSILVSGMRNTTHLFIGPKMPMHARANAQKYSGYRWHGTKHLRSHERLMHDRAMGCTVVHPFVSPSYCLLMIIDFC
ncbi:hypothetical protein L1987_22670 [Smallanthus sonchifolius]|uniref:Uncharacterized protein n=1 Tax=Smallanthus sonchifolius TaxID=185202 RepID=A0ACB9IH04_9ASTR|nr:hypothetical protein L1987_22670 [Smallanthus sonchifolius]